MKKLIIIMGVLLLVWSAYGQKEQVKFEYSIENMDTTQFSKIVRSYNRIIRAKEEKLQLFKVDLIGPFLFLASNWEENDNAQNKVVNLAYEQKIKPNWSWIIESSFKADRGDFQEIQGVGGIRYYYNMKRRMLKGKSANNFSGNYFSTTFNYGHRYHDDDNQITWNILYGLQRRLGRYGFIDINVGLENIFEAYETNETGTEFFGAIKWGLAF